MVLVPGPTVRGTLLVGHTSGAFVRVEEGDKGVRSRGIRGGSWGYFHEVGSSDTRSDSTDSP